METSHQSPHGLARIWPWSWRIWYNLISLVAAVNKPQLTLNLNHHFSLKLSDPANYSRNQNGIFGNGKVDNLWIDGFNTYQLYNSIIDLNFLSSWYFEFAWWYSKDCSINVLGDFSFNLTLNLEIMWSQNKNANGLDQDECWFYGYNCYLYASTIVNF